ncbi:alkaline phosphatase family protein, partial [Candidatus Aerophobetes bacterium]|nr:alkaline phosphatase family protein [Candidatus Aerophobetes bacterium]
RISSKEGLPLPRGGFNALTLGWIDTETLAECIDYQNIWLADACVYLLENKEWDLFFMHAHCPDWAYHTFANKLDPSLNPNKDEVAEYEKLELKMYRSLDRMIGKIIEKASDETLIIVVSDHGAKATTHHFDPVKLLIEAGLTVLKEDEIGRKVIDWERTKAVVQRSCYIYINLKGRDPQGIVEPGEEYEKLRDDIIKLLYDYTDEKTGKKPIVFALKREDARIIGLYGDRIGDIVFAISPDFGHQHGPHLPTAKYGIGSLQGLFIMKGPGVKKNYLMKRTMWLTDIVPTICYLADLPIPEHAEGGILYQALENPNLKLDEIKKIKENYERLKSAYEGEQALSHTYHM